MRITLALLLLITCFARADAPVSDSGILLDQPWKIAVHEFAVQKVRHASWGLAHSERNYHQALALAASEARAVDADALLAAAYLHDLGGLAGFEAPGVDHAVRSAELAEPLLRGWGFPMAKFPLVREIILGHTYYGPAPQSFEALCFRDADLLDFLGAIGVARLAAATPELGREPTLATPFEVAAKFAADLPPKLTTRSAQVEAIRRVAEMTALISSVRAYTHGGTAF